MANSSPNRVAALLLCLPLAACAAGGALPGEPDAAAAPALRSSATAGGARGGAATAAARGDNEPADAGDALTQARVDCWMMVEHKKELRGIDQRIAFIDKCVAGQVKSKPTP